MAVPEDEKDWGRKAPPAARKPMTPSAAPGETTEFNLPTPALRALEQRYDLLAEIGRGGMGVVYRARDRETEETVALKVLKPDIATRPDVIERFKAELRLARKITHKNVCRVYDLDRFDTVAAISMEYVEGESLRELLRRSETLSLRHGLRIIRQAIAGLREAHAQGVVHRDLKPENILIARDGTVKVMDFGIARSVEGDATTTGTGILVGTPAYMSPEQAEGKTADVRSDIYALGLILYEVFAGQRAFDADTPVALALKHVQEGPPAPRELEPTIPAHVEKAILKCLEKKPTKRFQSVDELEAALTGGVEASPAVVEAEVEIPVPLHLAAWRRSDRYLFAAAAMSLLLYGWLFLAYHPARSLRFTIDGAAARKLAQEAATKLGWSVTPGKPRPEFWEHSYVAAGWTLPAAQVREFLEQGESCLSWRVPFQDGAISVDSRGRLTQAWKWAPQPTPSRNTENPKEAQRRATEVLRALYGHEWIRELEKAEVKSVPGPPWGGLQIRWVLPSRWPPWMLQASVSFGASEALSVGRQMWLPPQHWPGSRFGFSEPERMLLVLYGFLALTVGLFLWRRRRAPASPVMLAISLFGGVLGAGYFVHGVDFERLDSLKGVMAAAAPWLKVLYLLIAFLVSALAAYAMLSAAEYYLRRSLPGCFATCDQFGRIRLEAKAAGTALLRGAALGAVFAALVLSLTTIGWQKGVLVPGLEYVAWGPPWALWSWMWVTPISPFPNFALRFSESLFASVLLLTLPLAWLARVTSRRWVWVTAVIGLWLLAGSSLQGTAPRVVGVYYAFAGLQAAFLALVFLRYDLLTVWSTIFTVQTAVAGLPTFELFRSVDPLPYAMGLVAWFLVVLFGVYLAFRPQVVAGWRRVVTAFE